MVNYRNIALAASAIIGLASAAPTEIVPRQWTTGVVNNTQEFYLRMTVTDGDDTYTQYACKYHLATASRNTANTLPVEAYHTGAGMADPVFVQGAGTPAYLNGTQLQFDQSQYPLSANGFPSDTNYGRWEPVTITAGYGSGPWVNGGSQGLYIDQEEHDGWIVCEWSHTTGAVLNAPQLFQMVKGFDGTGDEPYQVPSSCARVLLFPEFI